MRFQYLMKSNPQTALYVNGKPLEWDNASGGTRTHTNVTSQDFESCVSANSTTLANNKCNGRDSNSANILTLSDYHKFYFQILSKLFSDTPSRILYSTHRQSFTYHYVSLQIVVTEKMCFRSFTPVVRILMITTDILLFCRENHIRFERMTSLVSVQRALPD